MLLGDHSRVEEFIDAMALEDSEFEKVVEEKRPSVLYKDIRNNKNVFITYISFPRNKIQAPQTITNT